MMERFPLGEYLPDLAPIGHPGLLRAENVVPRADGYGPFPSWRTLGAGALDARVRGSISGRGYDGAPFHFAGTADKLWHYGSAGFTDASGASAPYATATTERWEFVQFGTRVLATNFAKPIQGLVLPGATFSDLAALAPQAKRIGSIKSFVMVGNTSDPGDGPVPIRVWWCGNGDATSWPAPGSDAAKAVESDYQDLDAGAGSVQAIVGGLEVGFVFQEQAVHRADYVGGDLFFTFTPIERARGLLAPGAIARRGRLIVYLSPDGFHLLQESSSTPIGDQKLDRTVLGEIDYDFLDRMSAAATPNGKLFAFLYPTVGSGGVPNRIALWDSTLNRWSMAEPRDLDVLATTIQPGDSMDDPDVPMDTAPFAMDATSAFLSGVEFGAYSSDHDLGAFNGPALPAMVETGDREGAPGRRVFVRGARPVVNEAALILMAVGYRARAQDDVQQTAFWTPDATGYVPLRASGRYLRGYFTIQSFERFQGFEVDLEDDGAR